MAALLRNSTPCTLSDAIAFLDRIIQDSRIGSEGTIRTSSTTINASSVLKDSAPAIVSEGEAGEAEAKAQAKAYAPPSPVQSQSAADGEPKQGTKALSTPAAAASGSNAEVFYKALIMVAKVLQAEPHPQSEKLLICKVEVQPGDERQVVAGLQKHIVVDELRGRKVCTVCNLKPAKLAGQASEAMILAGDHMTADGMVEVKLLQPPDDANVGERVLLDGVAPPQEAPAKQISSKVWEKIVSQLRVSGGAAAFEGCPLVTASGRVSVPSLPDGSGIH
eukprot:TRINITY_DN5083_c0_g1_i1.p1 TRINITY_DN5083_c0_g1~~TRINITY_DN5083_c0_g1_i1.p1  ORF type:complete len:277 (-),score=71.00 TRINITY_DN5083_c0_g1_i1:280-1110(-)